MKKRNLEFLGFPSYDVYEDGTVLNILTNRKKRYHLTKGYPRLDLYNLGVRKNIHLHRLLAICFIENTRDKVRYNHVDHIDGNKLNFSLDNLRWVSPKENIRFGREMDWDTKHKRTHNRKTAGVKE